MLYLVSLGGQLMSVQHYSIRACLLAHLTGNSSTRNALVRAYRLIRALLGRALCHGVL